MKSQAFGKDIEPKYYQNLMETMNGHKGQNENKKIFQKMISPLSKN